MRKYVLAAVLMLLCSSASVNCYAAKEWIQSGPFSYKVKDDGTAATVDYNTEDDRLERNNGVLLMGFNDSPRVRGYSF
ncbi:MAG: hypothetical protein K6A72_07200 [Lachnospiraceae bacterium]|nr:hypothetical protein [Lachnospiraceae bacterium]